MQPNQIKRLAHTNYPILILGPTGTGKSRLAKLIHKESNKRKWVCAHMASLSDQILESELFGHMKGAFSGAHQNHRGYFETVCDGTLFLDEIGELSLQGQKKLLQVLEEKEFTPLGSCTPLPFFGRIIAATHQDLEKRVKEGTFRADLYFRLNGFTLEIPPLHKRPEKLEELTGQFLNELSLEHGETMTLSPVAKQKLCEHSWPGNVRELKQVLTRAAFFATEGTINLDHLQLGPNPHSKEDQLLHHKKLPNSYWDAIGQFEQYYLTRKLEELGGRINHAARTLGMSKTSLIAKLKKYGINSAQIKIHYQFNELQRMAS